jgi:alpha-amylase/alpha-mannosidase (GH57 family)
MTDSKKSPLGSICLGLLLHSHQPVGNFPWVFQQVYEQSYLPMLEALERHPTVRFALHYTGSLLDWLEEAHPQFIHRVAALAQRNQVEIVSGGYYEPILPMIPDRDKIAQIRRLSERIERDFGVKPTGMWLAERVWEPALARSLTDAGIEWTILDDIHFKNVGLDDSDLYGYYATEDQSSVLKVYATSKMLRYTIPWRPVSETIATLRALATSESDRIIVMGDDSEKFGSWPETHKYCWGKDGRSGWVEEFFSALEHNKDWLHLKLLGEYASTHSALGRIYLPTSSYIEMTEWALPPQKSYLFGKLLHQLEHEKHSDVLQFMRGGFWRNFLVRYPEVNNQHKKMLRVHERVYAAGATEASGIVHLWKAQANDTYWHGLFGGIYMTHVRSAIYHHLIKAENAADRTLHGTAPWQQYEFIDFERNTQKKLIIESDQQNLYIDPEHGGTLFEWDLRRSAHNVLSVMTRSQESYHQVLREHERERRRKVAKALQQQQRVTHSEEQVGSPHTTIRVKEANLDQHLIVDRHRRTSLVDHFLPSGLPMANFAQMRYEEQGDFVDQRYKTRTEQDEMGLRIIMERSGHVQRTGVFNPIPIHLTKTIFLPLGEERLVIRYIIENKGLRCVKASFGCEWNVNLLGGGGNPQAYCRVAGQQLENSHFDSTGEVAHIDEFSIGNIWLQQEINFSLSEPATLWHFSIDAITGSEAGFERTHQGSCFVLLWPLVLEAGQSWSVEKVIDGRLPK